MQENLNINQNGAFEDIFKTVIAHKRQNLSGKASDATAYITKL